MTPAERKQQKGSIMIFDMTDRGFRVITFEDHYGSVCSLQKSSALKPECIWFGVIVPFKRSGDPPCWPRMHLTQDQVKKLLPHLQHFADRGDLP